MIDPKVPIPGTAATVNDFWQWAFFDLVSNDIRGAFAEYLVGLALGVIDQSRVSWDAVDLRYRSHGIEVKAAGRGQAWPQDGPSTPRFGIARRRGWDALTNTYAERRVRSASVYVFAVHEPYPATAAEVLDPTTWTFFVVATATINRDLGGQESIGLTRLRGIATEIGFDDVRAAVDDALFTIGPST